MITGMAAREFAGTARALARIIAGCRSDQAIALGALNVELPDSVAVTIPKRLDKHPGAITRSGSWIDYRPGVSAWCLIDFDTKGMPKEVSDRIDAAGSMKRGRKSAEQLSVIDINVQQPRLSPPAYLSRPELELFSSIVDVCDAEHFRKTDLPLLSRYCEAAILAEQAALELRNGAVVDGKPSPWIVVQEKCVRALVSLSMRGLEVR